MAAMHGSRLKFEIQASRNLAMHDSNSILNRSWIDARELQMEISFESWHVCDPEPTPRAELQLCLTRGELARVVKKKKKKEKKESSHACRCLWLAIEIRDPGNSKFSHAWLEFDPGLCARAAPVIYSKFSAVYTIRNRLIPNIRHLGVHTSLKSINLVPWHGTDGRRSTKFKMTQGLSFGWIVNKVWCTWAEFTVI